MKKIASALVLLLIVCSAALAGDVYVDGYYKSNGTYVAPHYRSAPDGNPYNNWSTKGNTNPYTGEVGTKNPDRYYSPPLTTPSYNSDPYGTRRDRQERDTYDPFRPRY